MRPFKFNKTQELLWKKLYERFSEKVELTDTYYSVTWPIPKKKEYMEFQQMRRYQHWVHLLLDQWAWRALQEKHKNYLFLRGYLWRRFQIGRRDA